MSSSEEEFFNSLKKKRKRNDSNTNDIISSDEEAPSELQTPKVSCAPRSTHTRSSERLRNKKQFVMPKKEDVLEDIPSSEKIKTRTPSKCVNDFTRVTHRYNADRYETFNDDEYESDDIDEFINDEEESEEDSSNETPHPSRIKGYKRRLLPKDSDSDSEDDNACQPLQNDSDADNNSVKEGSSARNRSRSNSPVTGLKLKKGKYKSNVIESSDSDTELEEGNAIESSGSDTELEESNVIKSSGSDTELEEREDGVTNDFVVIENDQNQTPVENSNSETHNSVGVRENREIPTETVVCDDSVTEVVITDSDEELCAWSASVESNKPDHRESESSSGCESDVSDSRSDVTDSGSETEEELQKNDRAHRQRQQKLKKFEDFKAQRRKKKLPT